LATKNLLEYAKKFYNCDSINAVPLENDGEGGTFGNHWEKTFFFDELMTGTKND
jgi:hypothetical protein